MPADASADAIRGAYRRLVRRAHPDVGGTAERFHEVQRAWELLGTEHSRALYDLTLRTRAAEPPPRPASSARHGGAAYADASTPSERAWTSTDAAARAARTRSRHTSARSFGHPGGSARQHYLDLLRSRLADPAAPTAPARRFVYEGPPPLAWTRRPYVRRAFWLSPLLAAFAAIVISTVAGVIGVLTSPPTSAPGQAVLDALLLGLLLAVPAALLGVALAWPLGALAFSAQSGRRRSVTRSAEDALRHERELRDYPALLRQYEEQAARVRPLRERVLGAPYAAANMADVPADIRIWLERAQSEEATARELAKLGADFTVWSDVAVPGTTDKVDHLVLGFQGLFVVDSGSAAGTSEWAAEGLPAETVADAVKKRVRILGRSLGVPIAAIVLVAADEEDSSSGARLLRGGSVPTFLIARLRLAAVLGTGLPEMERGSRDAVFSVRSRLMGNVPFV